MVHSRPEFAESTKLLSYSQLKRLEKIDAKKERESKLLEIARTTVEAGGRAAQGLFSNQIAGTAAFILAATATYPAWQPIVWNSLSTLTANIGEAWKHSVIPGADTLFGRDDVNGRFGVGVTTDNFLDWVSFAWYTDTVARNAALTAFSITHPLHVEAVDRTGSASTGWSIPPTSLAAANFRSTQLGQWGVYTPAGQLVSIGRTQAEAQAAADSYNANPLVANALKPVTVRQIA